MSDPIEKIRTAEAWNEFCELLKKAGEVLHREDLELSDFDRGEGHRYLSRLLRAGIQSFAENTGPLHPEFREPVERDDRLPDVGQEGGGIADLAGQLGELRLGKPLGNS